MQEQEEANVDDIENTEPGEETKQKPKKKMKKIRKKKSKKSLQEDEKEPDEEDQARLQAFQQGPRFMQRKSSSLSLEVEKMSKGKPLTHFQVLCFQVMF